jgi:hypothetical protein
VLELAPLVRSLVIGGLENSEFTGPDAALELAALLGRLEPHARLDRLAFSRAIEYAEDGELGYGDVFAQVIGVSSLRLARLRFDECHLTARGVHALIASGKLAALDTLRFDSDVGLDAMLAIAAHAPALRTLEVRLGGAFPELAPRLPALAELVLHAPRLDDFETLADSPAGATLRSLAIRGGSIDFSPLGRLRNLEELTLYEGTIDSIATSTLPPLRVVRMIDPRRGDVAAIANVLGPQLELLQATGSEYPELRSLVAGELRDGPRDDYGIGFL